MKKFKTILLVLMILIVEISSAKSIERYRDDIDIFQSSGVIVGSVLDETENTLPGASIVIRELLLGTAANLQGRFQLRNVPEGQHKIEVLYLGSITQAIEVEVNAGEIVDIGVITLKQSLNELGEIVITASIEGQQRAYNQQKNSDQIKTIVSSDLVNQFPDINVAEALQRVSGVNIQRSFGEGTNIRIRGTPNNYTTVSVDGAQLPNTDGDQRTEALDLIPAELLATMEITKSLLPENDGDAIGGSVNLKTTTATSSRGKIKGSVAGGYSEITERGTFRTKLNYNKRFFDKKVGVKIGGSFYTTNSGEERINGIWQRVLSGTDDSEQLIEALTELQVRPTINIRERLGANATLDYKFSKSSQIVFTTSYYSLRDQNERYRTRYRSRQEFPELGNPLLAGFENGRGRLQKDLAAIDQRRENLTFTLGGDHLVNHSGKVDWGLNYSDSKRDEEAVRSVFAANGIQFDIDLADSNFPQYIPRNFDESDNSLYDFLGYQIESPIEITGANFAAFGNYEQLFKIGEKVNSTLKFGGKIRLQENSRRRNNIQYQPFLGNFNLEQVQGPDQGNILGNRYTMGSFPSASRMARHFEQTGELYQFDTNESRFNAESNAFDAQEDIIAFYVQDKLDFGKFSAVFGIRYERTDATYQSNLVQRDFGELTSEAIEGGLKYDFLLPSISTKYALDIRTNLRLSYFESFARPDFIAIVPGEIINFASQSVRRGNPELNPAFARNLDFMIEHYFKKEGTATFGVFYKNVENFIFNQRSFVTDNPLLENFVLQQFVNGDVANVLGFEANFAKKFTFLPGFLSGFGMFANYTYVRSSSSFTGAVLNENTGESELRTRDGVPFVGQADHTWNAALYYDKGKFSVRASLNYQSAAFLSFDVDPFFDFILEERYQLDANASYRIKDNWSVFLEAQNILDSPVIEHQQRRDRISEYKIFGAFVRIGVTFSFKES